ncbi:MAG: contractile injection system protein, VgrG/Pvc8 family [Polyangiales bacterium]
MRYFPHGRRGPWQDARGARHLHGAPAAAVKPQTTSSTTTTTSRPSQLVEGVASVTRLTGADRTWGENFRASPEARRSRRRVAEARTSDERRFFGTGRVFDLCAGYKFTVEEHPRPDLNAEYLAIEA